MCLYCIKRKYLLYYLHHVYLSIEGQVVTVDLSPPSAPPPEKFFHNFMGFFRKILLANYLIFIKFHQLDQRKRKENSWERPYALISLVVAPLILCNIRQDQCRGKYLHYAFLGETEPLHALADRPSITQLYLRSPTRSNIPIYEQGKHN